MAADLLRPSSSELKEQEMVSRRLEPQSSTDRFPVDRMLNAPQSSGQEAQVEEFLSFNEESATGHCELGNLQIACVAAIAQLQGRLEAIERQSQDQIETLKDQVIMAIMNDETFASGSTARLNSENIILSQRIDKMHDKAETSYAEMSRRILALELHNTSVEKRPLLNPVDLSQTQERVVVGQGRIVRSSQQMDMTHAASLDSQVTCSPRTLENPLTAVTDNRVSRSISAKDTRSRSLESLVTTIGDACHGVRSTATILIQEVPARVSSPTGYEHSGWSSPSPTCGSPVRQSSVPAQILSPRAIQISAGTASAAARASSPVESSRSGMMSSIQGNPPIDDYASSCGSRMITPMITPAAGFRYPMLSQALSSVSAATTVRAPSPVQSSRTGIILAESTKGNSLETSWSGSTMPSGGVYFPSPALPSTIISTTMTTLSAMTVAPTTTMMPTLSAITVAPTTTMMPTLSATTVAPTTTMMPTTTTITSATHNMTNMPAGHFVDLFNDIGQDACGGRRSPGVPEAEPLNTIPWSSTQHSSPILASSSVRSVSASVSVVRQASTGSAAAPPAVTRQVSTGYASVPAPPAVTRQFSTGSGAAPPAVVFQPSIGTPSRSSAPAQGTMRGLTCASQLSSGMTAQHRTSAGSLGPGRGESKGPAREAKAHSSDRWQSSRGSFRTSQSISQTITGGRPATPRGSKGAISQVWGPTTATTTATTTAAAAAAATTTTTTTTTRGSVGKGLTTCTSIGKGAATSQSNRARFFPATVQLGTPAAAPATTTQQVSHLSPKLNRLVDGTPAAAPTTPTQQVSHSSPKLNRLMDVSPAPGSALVFSQATTNQPVLQVSPKLNYRMAPAPSSDGESSPQCSPQSSPLPATENRKRKTKGPIVKL